ncbi:penicillin-binding protein 1B [Paraferrimonas sp. SM1919]|uniref:penicillin-binding protein 1B n=1 Tax=Paraferrimonas sp. SM1919 TaxID=2662263 RepID=UPI0013D56AF9|nr:penicillin-binding protein 1B [Paraferrimonas sp. SM1919]
MAYKRPPIKKKAPITAPKKSFKSRILGFLFKISIIIFAGLFLWAIYLDGQIAKKFEGQKWHLPAQVFGRALPLFPDAAVSIGQVIEELKLLGYRKVANPSQVGEFSASASRVDVWRRGFLHPDGWMSENRFMVSFGNYGVERVSRHSDGREMAINYLEPMLLDRMITAGTEDRVFVPMAQIPKTLQEALILVEDRSFYDHWGVNPMAIIRALWVNVNAGRAVQGGSTITQQLAKNFFLTSERSLWRKAREAFMSLIIDARYSKTEILEAYLNELYMGQDKARGVHGMGLAAQHYFGRPLPELTLSQQALLIAIIKGPSYYNPWRYPQRARERRDLVLKIMYQAKAIGKQQYIQAIESSMGLRKSKKLARQQLPAFFSHVQRELKQRYGGRLAQSSGLKVYTSLDPLAQHHAEAAVVEQMRQLAKRTKNNNLQIGMVVTDKYQNGIAAMVGDKDVDYAGFNRALDIRRPIGSLVKPFIYLTALSKPAQYNLSTPLANNPLEFVGPKGQIWAPKNYDESFGGVMPLQEGLVTSMNLPTVNLGMELGLDTVIATLKQAGWNEQLEEVPAILLGAVNGSPLMVAQMYHTIANKGVYQQLRSVVAVLDNDDNLLEVSRDNPNQIFLEGANYLVEQALHQVVERGTAQRLGRSQPYAVLAGKTGTSNDSRDSWFVGYDERNVAAIWVGRDDNDTTSLFGSSGAMTIYQDFLQRRAPMSLLLAVPDTVIEGHFDPTNGQAMDKDCRNTVAYPALAEAYLPSDDCDMKAGSWFRKLFGG